MKTLSTRATGLAASPTLSLNARLAARRHAGEEVLNLSVGEPDFAMPESAALWARKAIDDGRSRYTEVAGVLELRERIVRKLAEDNGLRYGPDDIVVSAGAKHALYNAFFVLCGSGDEVVIPSPYWVTYPEQVRAAGAVPVFAATDERSGFKLTAARREAAVTERTKAVVLNSPGNPTGATYTRAELAELAEVVLRHDLYVVEDLIYEHFHYGPGPVPSIAALGDELRERTVVVNGISKSCAMTGWRIGYTAAPSPLARWIKRFQGQVTSNASVVAQYAAIGAMDDVPWRDIASYRDRRDFGHRALTGIPEVRCVLPDGAFYLFPDVSGLLGRTHEGVPLRTSDEFCARLLDVTGVGLVPGTGFGADDHLRLSYAVSPDVLAEALSRLSEFAAALR
ncbi:pyridoxal phosphate-dependent aminotransferase [Amycolatopsis rhizosphaerae]|uniref:Aminotransferase n=1 Tax=Amycolatopsis rhizosphaerae TaxID=2053003 RepID=A0A558CS34_9PSEU|nr:pyridoxal phosphate-dependent aminotransferase [Amycolatopsis rhizosphaerae]TVT51585.1 pyridoxal phosphate-dependent aminotransferase [Amycolatopsis rhizosphaerae]